MPNPSPIELNQIILEMRTLGANSIDLQFNQDTKQHVCTVTYDSNTQAGLSFTRTSPDPMRALDTARRELYAIRSA